MASLVDRYFSQADFDAIEAAVKKAEAGTSGEIAVELASHSWNWLTERLLHALIFTLGCVLATLLLTRDVGWGVYYNTTQAMLWGGIGFVIAYFGWGVYLKRESRRRRVVWNRANERFKQIAPVTGRTGVLLYLSMAEHQAALVADTGIASRVDADYWAKPHAIIVAGMRDGRHAEGIIEAVELIALELARHFPPGDDDRNELPNEPRIVD